MLDQKASRDSDGERFNFTLSFYFTANNFSKLDANAQYSLFCIGGTDSSQNYQITFKNKIINFCKKSSSPQGGAITIAGSDKTDIITFVFKTASDGKQTVEGYLNGSRKINATTSDKISSDDIILGYEVSHSSIRVDDVYLFNTALSEDDVKTLYNNSKNQKVQTTTETIKDRAIGPDGNVIAAVRGDLAKVENVDDRKGWYYVNSHSDWNTIKNEEIATGKEIKPLIKENNIQKAIYSAKTDDEKAKNNGYFDYIAKNVTRPKSDKEGKNDFWYSENNANVQTSIKQILSGESLTESPATTCKFFVDENYHLRCFYNTGSATKSTDIDSGKGYNTQCSLVYYKNPDKQQIKTEALNSAVHDFISGLTDSSKSSHISAVRFSTDSMFSEDFLDSDNYTEEQVDANTKSKDELKKLVLLDWLDGDNGNDILTNGNYRKDVANSQRFGDSTTGNDELTGEYNYFLTGGTYTWTGLSSFYYNLASDETISSSSNPKYLILFTDGKDNDVDVETVDEDGNVVSIKGFDKAKYWADELKNEKNNYTIFCVLFSGGSVSEEKNPQEYQKVMKFLKEYVASDEKYVYDATNKETLDAAFISILNQIKKPLTNYTIQDYIDPRFDLVDKNLGVLKLGAGGNITDSNGNPLKTVTDSDGYDYIPKELSYKGGEYDKAKIYYDSEKDMYYLRWKVDSIGGGNTPFNTEGTETYLKESQADNPETTDENEEQAGRWYSTITVKAKEDFIGGNAILTNGNEAGMNLVFASKELYDDAGTSLGIGALRNKLSGLSGTDKSQDRNYDGTETDVESPSKGFPRVCTNVRLLPIQTKPLNEVIYLGEVVSPTIMLNEIESDYMSGSYYLEYLERYAYRLYGDSKELSDGERPLIQLLNEWLGVDKPEKIVKTFTIPYIYLPSVKYTAEGKIESKDKQNSVGTPERNQKDIVGFITYTWKRESENEPQQKIEGLDSEDNPQYNITLEYVVKDTKQIKYDLELKFTPLPQDKELTGFELDKNFIPDDTFFNATDGAFVTEGVSDWTFGTRDDYLKALVSDKSNGDTESDVYEWSSGYKPTKGNTQVEERQNYGDATISEDKYSLIASTTYTKDVVNAGLALEMIVKGEDLIGGKIGTDIREFTFTATRNYTDALDPVYYKKDEYGNPPSMGANATNEEYKLTFTIDNFPDVIDTTSTYTIWAKLTTITKKGETLEKDETLENGLPIGTYTITKDLEDTEKITIKDEKYFKNLNADSNRGNFIYTRFPENVCNESSNAAKDTGDEKYLIWDETKNLDFAKENIAENTKDTTTNSLTFYFGTKLNGITKGESVKDKPETTDDYAKDRLGIIMLSYGSNRLAISKEVTSKNIAVIKEQAVLDNFWKFDIKLTFDTPPTDTIKYSLKWLDLKTGNELTGDDIPKDSGRNSITKLTFTKDSTDSKVYTAQISVKSNTQVILEQLPNDVSYTVSEIRSEQKEDGDFQDRYRYDILVEGEKPEIADDQSKGTSSGKLSPASSVNFINQFPSPELPSAGGADIDIKLYGSIMLVVSAGLYLAIFFNKKRKG